MIEIRKITRKIYRKYGGYLSVPTVWITIIVTNFRPIWLRNDDLGIQSISEGNLGMASESTHLMVSTDIYGTLLSAIPHLLVSRHVIVTYFILTLSMIYFIKVSKYSGFSPTRISIFTLAVFVFPFLRPEFSMTSGISACIGMQLLYFQNDFKFPKRQAKEFIVGACILLSLAFMVRPLTTILISSLSIFWIRRDAIKKSTFYVLAALLTFFVVTLINQSRIDSAIGLRSAKSIRPIFTDYIGWSAFYWRNGVTRNEFDLISNWFLFDNSIYNPAALIKGLDLKIGPLGILPSGYDFNLQTGFNSFISIFTSFPILIVLLFVLVLRSGSGYEKFISFSIPFVTAFVLGLLLKEPGKQVMYPVIVLSICMTLFGVRARRHYMKATRKNTSMTIGVVILCWMMILTQLFSQAKLNNTKKVFIDNYRELPYKSEVFIWGDQLPFEFLISPFDSPSTLPGKFYASGWTLDHPESNFQLLLRNGWTFEKHFLSTGLIFNGRSDRPNQLEISILEKLCQERYRGVFKLSNLYDTGIMKQYSISCSVLQDND